MKTLLCRVIAVLCIGSAVLVGFSERAQAATPPAANPDPRQQDEKIAGLIPTNDVPVYRSGCTHVLVGPSVVYPGDEITITAKAAYGGVCARAYVYMSFAEKAVVDEGYYGESTETFDYIYDFCYWGDAQPIAPEGAGAWLPDDGTHTITFTIRRDLLYPLTYYYVTNGLPCSSNPGNTKNIFCPAVVMSGTGGTHGWSSVMFFELCITDEESPVGDFDGDGKTDPAKYEQATGSWKIMLSGSGYGKAVLNAFMGGTGWTSATADYDGDGLSDPAVYSEYTGDWNVQLSSAGYMSKAFSDLLGGIGYMPAPGDYDGDGFADPTVYNKDSGTWKAMLTSSGYQSSTLATLGGDGSYPVAADYDGDRKTDVAVYSPSNSTWTIKMSGSGGAQVKCVLIGGPGWIPATGDYDGDRLADPAIHSGTGEWRFLMSSANYGQISAVLDL